MNKYLKALNDMFKHTTNGQNEEYLNQKYDDFITLHELVSKATPKKPKHNEEFDLYGCPNCDFCDQVWGTFKKTNCCPKCGQTIDWSDEE